MGDWGLGQSPNPQSPIPNPQSPKIIFNSLKLYFPIKIIILNINIIYNKNGCQRIKFSRTNK